MAKHDTDTAKTVELAEDTAEKKVRIRIPKTRSETEDVYVSVNNRNWLIQRGVEVEVPECVAEVLRNSELAEEAALRFIEQNAK